MKLALALVLPLLALSQAFADTDLQKPQSRSQSIAALMERTKAEQGVQTLNAGDSEPSQPAPLQMMKGLALTAGVFLIGVGIYRRISRSTGQSYGRRISIIERSALTPKTALILAQIEGQRVLLAVGSEQVSQISGIQQTITLTNDLAVSEDDAGLRIACND